MANTKVRIDYGNWGDYREVFKVTQWVDGAVYRTVFVGFVKSTYALPPGHIACPLSTRHLNKDISVMA